MSSWVTCPKPTSLKWRGLCRICPVTRAVPSCHGHLRNGDHSIRSPRPTGSLSVYVLTAHVPAYHSMNLQNSSFSAWPVLPLFMSCLKTPKQPSIPKSKCPLHYLGYTQGNKQLHPPNPTLSFNTQFEPQPGHLPNIYPSSNQDR